MSVTNQLSLLTAPVGADGESGDLDGLEGLLCGGGQPARRPDGSVRLSIVVREAWRAEVLVAELGAVGVSAETLGQVTARRRRSREPAGPALPDLGPALPELQHSVRTGFDLRLAELANAWTRGSKLAPPGDFALDGSRLRWWTLAAGRADPAGGYRLGLGANAADGWRDAGAALTEAGLPAVFRGPRSDGPAYRLTGGRRLALLRELVGEPPAGVPAHDWPAH